MFNMWGFEDEDTELGIVLPGTINPNTSNIPVMGPTGYSPTGNYVDVNSLGPLPDYNATLFGGPSSYSQFAFAGGPQPFSTSQTLRAPITTPPFTSTTPKGNSTRDAVIGTVNNSFGLLASIFGKPQPVPVAPVYQGGLPPDGSAAGSKVASGLGAAFQSIADQFGVSTTTLILLGVGGFYLLRKEPPKRRY